MNKENQKQMNYASVETCRRLRAAGFPMDVTKMESGAIGVSEILRQLPAGYACGVQGKYFWCGIPAESRAVFHESLAEACAIAWLNIHENNNTK